MCQALYQVSKTLSIQQSQPQESFLNSKCPQSLADLRTFACAGPPSSLQFPTHTQLCKPGSFSSVTPLLHCHLLLGVFHQHPSKNRSFLLFSQGSSCSFSSYHFIAQKQDGVLFRDAGLGVRGLGMNPHFSSADFDIEHIT